MVICHGSCRKTKSGWTGREAEGEEAVKIKATVIIGAKAVNQLRFSALPNTVCVTQIKSLSLSVSLYLNL